MAKGKARNATASVADAILRQAATPKPEPVEHALREAPEPEPTYKPATKGVKAGLKEGEIRITCIFTEQQSHVLHDWAKTTGHTFREVCLSMAESYIQNTIRPATSRNRRLNLGKHDMPQDYADLYDDDTPNEWAEFFE